MVYTLLGFGLAAAFGMAASLALGVKGLLSAPWVDPIFWVIIGTGLVLDHQAAFRAWFVHQRPHVQNAVAAIGFVSAGVGVLALLRDQPWTWHIAG
jgi:hypothetical protein